jgi:hypothetical protein
MTTTGLAPNSLPTAGARNTPPRAPDRGPELADLLTVIVGYSELLMREALPPETAAAALRQLHIAAKRAAELTRR